MPPVQPDSCPRQTPVHVRAGTLAYPRAAQAVLPPTPLWPQVHEDCACTLNQTNVGSNNNKLYIIQLLEEGDRFACWNRWGRVVSATTFPPCTHLLPTSSCSHMRPAPQGPHSLPGCRPHLPSTSDCPGALGTGPGRAEASKC